MSFIHDIKWIKYMKNASNISINFLFPFRSRSLSLTERKQWATVALIDKRSPSMSLYRQKKNQSVNITERKEAAGHHCITDRKKAVGHCLCHWLKKAVGFAVTDRLEAIADVIPTERNSFHCRCYRQKEAVGQCCSHWLKEAAQAATVAVTDSKKAVDYCCCAVSRARMTYSDVSTHDAIHNATNITSSWPIPNRPGTELGHRDKAICYFLFSITFSFLLASTAQETPLVHSQSASTLINMPAKEEIFRARRKYQQWSCSRPRCPWTDERTNWEVPAARIYCSSVEANQEAMNLLHEGLRYDSLKAWSSRARQ